MWTSKTRQFGRQEMGDLESMSAGELANALRGSDPVVALRALAEVMLNADDAKLTALLADAALTRHWRSYESDPEVDARDHEYARQLNQRLH